MKKSILNSPQKLLKKLTTLLCDLKPKYI